MIDTVECYAISIPCIQKDVQSRMKWERVDIEDKYKRFVIGKQGAKLREISMQTGAKVILKDRRDVYILLGNEEQRKQARVLIGTIVVSTRFICIGHTLDVTLHVNVRSFVCELARSFLHSFVSAIVFVNQSNIV